MSHAHERPRTRRSDQIDLPHADGTFDPVKTADVDQIYAAVETFAKSGKGNARDLPRFVTALPWEHKLKVRDLLPDLAKRIGGDHVFEIGLLAQEHMGVVLEEALKARPPISAESLRRHLRSAPIEVLAALAEHEAAFRAARKMLSGPLATELPQLAELPEAIQLQPSFVEWFATTSDPTVVAVTFARRGIKELATSLDKLNLWSWLDLLHTARNYFAAARLELLQHATTNSAAKEKISKLLGTFTSKAYTLHAGDIARTELRTQAETHASMDRILDTAARASSINEEDGDVITKRFKGEKAGDVFELIIAADLDLPLAIPLLAGAKGVTAQQMVAVLATKAPEYRIAILANDRLRADVRRVIGMGTPLTTLFPTAAQRREAHATMLHDEALREWAYQEKNPLTNLWVAAGSNHAKDACKLVKRELALSWVFQLPATAPKIELRRLALNCGDAKVTEHVHAHLLGDRKFVIEEGVNAVGPKPGDLQGERADRRAEAEAMKSDVDPKELLARFGDLDAAQRARALANGREMKATFGALGPDEAVRAVFLLGPTLPQLLALPIHNLPGVLDYMRTRPSEEEKLALQRRDVVAHAKAMLPHTSPLVVFPVLYDSHALAAALAANDDLIEWMLEETDPSLALARLSLEPARAKAAELLAQRDHVYDKLPAFKHLLPRGRDAFNTLVRSANDQDVTDEASRYKDGDARTDEVADKHAARTQHASAAGSLAKGLVSLSREHGTEDSALALVSNAPPAEQLALLDGTHHDAVVALKRMAPRSPAHVFHGVSTSALLAMKDGAAWLFESEPSYAILSRVGATELAQLAATLENDSALQAQWIAGLPDSAGLTARERSSLDSMWRHVTDDAFLRSLFKVRFGADIDASYVGSELRQLWGVLARLPPGHVNQHVIKTFEKGPIGKEAAGMWWHDSVILQAEPMTGNDTAYEDASVLSAEQIKKYYGLNDSQLAAASRPHTGWIERVAAGGFRIKPISSVPNFTATVLHEVGHAVDQMLGSHTQLIYGEAGWKMYGVDQFEQWATEMGALQHVKGAERARIVEAWQEALRSGRSVQDMVDADHPAMKLPTEDPLGRAAKAGQRFDYNEGDARHTIRNGHAFITHGQTLLSCKQQAAETAPSTYSMSAPAEYFAECYVEYYRGYAGTPDTQKNKGGHLAAWIKGWFDANVDTARLSPDRLAGNADKQPPRPKVG